MKRVMLQQQQQQHQQQCIIRLRQLQQQQQLSHCYMSSRSPYRYFSTIQHKHKCHRHERQHSPLLFANVPMKTGPFSSISKMCAMTAAPSSITSQYNTFSCLTTRTTNTQRKSFTSSSSTNHSDHSSSNNNTQLKEEIHIDFFGEPITFFFNPTSFSTTIPSPLEATAVIDAHIRGVTSKGLTNSNTSIKSGGDEYGISTQSAHSTSLMMVEALQIATLWNTKNKEEEEDYSSPMLTCAVVSPLLAAAGLGYAQRLDSLLSRTTAHYNTSSSSSSSTAPPNAIKITNPPQTPLQFIPLAQHTINAHLLSSSPKTLTSREVHHLQTLSYLLLERYDLALRELQNLLYICPGDALALSMIMDLCILCGNDYGARLAAGSVASYWSERSSARLSGGRTSQPGHTIGTSLISLGFALSSHSTNAEPLADSSLTTDATSFKSALCSGIAALSLAHVYESQGRSSEGVSLCAGYDGVQRFNKCGYIFFDCILGGYGGLFALDKDSSGADRQALRIYDEYFGERIIRYCVASSGSGDDNKKISMLEMMKAPKSSRREMVGRALSAPKSIFQSLFSGGSNNSSEGDENNNGKDGKLPASYSTTNTISTKEEATATASTNIHRRSAEDVLCWLPPTQQLLTNATMLLLRLTLSGSISQDDKRWKELRSAWIDLIESEIEATSNKKKLFPMAVIASSLLLDHNDSNVVYDGGVIDGDGMMDLSRGLCLMGRLMNLGHHHHQHEQDENNENESLHQKQWTEVVHYLISAKNKGSATSSSGTSNLVEMTLRPIMEHALCHAAALSNDYECLCYARAACSEGVTVRSNCPEVWFRYSVILEKLGDEVAAEDARVTSVSLGSGEGGFGE